MRQAKINRKTKETSIKCLINIDKFVEPKISTKIGILDHMLYLFSFHGNFTLEIDAKGDLEVDCHHLVEDVAIVLGKLFNKIKQQNHSINRYASNHTPLDEALALTVLDVSGRPFHCFNCKFDAFSIGQIDSSMVKHFFYSFAINAGITLHQSILYGENDHHKIEALFKSLARAVEHAYRLSNLNKISSSKGLIE